jgi:hypothetical protein
MLRRKHRAMYKNTYPAAFLPLSPIEMLDTIFFISYIYLVPLTTYRKRVALAHWLFQVQCQVAPQNNPLTAEPGTNSV